MSPRAPPRPPFPPYRGVICLVEVVDGCLVEQDRIVPFHLKHGPSSGDPSNIGSSGSINSSGSGGSTETFSVQEVGLLAPGPTRTGALYPGQVGYMIAGERGFTYEFARICANLREFARVYACSRECCDVTFLLRHPLFFLRSDPYGPTPLRWVSCAIYRCFLLGRHLWRTPYSVRFDSIFVGDLINKLFSIRFLRSVL